MMGPCVTSSGPILKVCKHSRSQNVIIICACIEDIQGWAISPRGAGFLFGGNIVDEVIINYYGTDWPKTANL